MDDERSPLPDPREIPWEEAIDAAGDAGVLTWLADVVDAAWSALDGINGLTEAADMNVSAASETLRGAAAAERDWHEGQDYRRSGRKAIEAADLILAGHPPADPDAARLLAEARQELGDD